MEQQQVQITIFTRKKINVHDHPLNIYAKKKYTFINMKEKGEYQQKQT